MKRILCLLVCLVMMLGLLPTVAGAATTSTVSSVSISELEHPVAEQALDSTYKIPNRGINYAKDKDYDEVIWYDMGITGADMALLKKGAKAEEGHYYVAELHLTTTEDAVFTSKGVKVEISADMELRVQDVEPEHENIEERDTAVTIRLYYIADAYFDATNPVKLTVDTNADGTINVGDRPWTADDFSFDGENYGKRWRYFDLNVYWYKGKQTSAKNLMNENERFEAGQTYTLKIELDASRLTKHGFFDPDVVIKLNGKKGEVQMGDDADYVAVALFRFSASESIDKVVIKGIEEPKVGGTRQRSGFTCSTDGVEEVDYNHWEVETSSGSKEFKGEFEAGKKYYLFLDLVFESGYSPSLTKKQISVNEGTVEDVIEDDGVLTVVIGFELGDLELEGIKVTTPPRKLEYYVGERFNTRGMVVSATYKDGHTEKITEYEYSPDGTLEKDDTVITITYTEGGVKMETTLNITVIDEDLKLTGIVITKDPKKTSYKTGEVFDPTGMMVTAVYDDKSTADVTNLEFDPAGELTLNDDVVIVSYTEGDKTVKDYVYIRVTQATKELADLVVTRTPDKLTYYEGEVFDPAGMVITAVYEDKSTKVLADGDYTFSPKTALSTDDDNVVITYVEKGVAKAVTVPIKVKESERKLSSLVVSTAPYKTTYTEGESFNPAGMVITAVYDDRTAEEVKSYTLEPSGKLSPGTKEVTVTYTEAGVTKTATVAITVKSALTNPFTDVKESDYFYEAVIWAYYHDPQITKGMTDTSFGPALTCTRGQVVTFLYRAAGEPTPKTKVNPFKDVKEDAFYYNAVLWAVENHITEGTSADTFSPGATCTIGHVITFIYRAAGEPGKTGATPWYTDAMNWAYEIGLFKDLAFSEIKADNDCPRRDIVNFLFNQPT